MKFKFWPDKQPAPEEEHGADSQAMDEMIVNELFMETSFEEPWQFVPEAQVLAPHEAMLEEIELHDEIELIEEEPLEVEQLHLPVPLPEPVSEPENVVRLSDVRRQKEGAEEAPALDMPAGEMMTFTPKGKGTWASRTRIPMPRPLAGTGARSFSTAPNSPPRASTPWWKATSTTTSIRSRSAL